MFGDRLLGDDHGGAKLCPESWLREVSVDRAGLAHQMRALVELPVELLLVFKKAREHTTALPGFAEIESDVRYILANIVRRWFV